MDMKTGAFRAQKESNFLPPTHRADPRPSVLTFSPLAWLKLRLFLHADGVEVAGFGVSGEDDLLYVEDFVSVKQTVTIATVELNDVAVADHFDRCIDADIPPCRCGRIWIHTHPGSSPAPSSTDEETFERVFGDCDWAVMAIVARGGASYARLRFNIGPGGECIIPVRVDWERFPEELMDREQSIADEFSRWMNEYGVNIHHPVALPVVRHLPHALPASAHRPALYPDPLERIDALCDPPFDERDQEDLIAAMIDRADEYYLEENSWH